MFLFQRYTSVRAPGHVWLCREKRGGWGGRGQVGLTRVASRVSTTSGWWTVAHACARTKRKVAWVDRHTRVKSRVVVARADFWYVDFLHQKNTFISF